MLLYKKLLLVTFGTTLVHLTLNTLDMSYFTCKWHSGFTLHVPNASVFVPVVYEVTSNKKYTKCFPPESLHAWTRVFMTFAPFPASRRSCEWCKGHKNALVECLFMFSWNWVHGFVSVQKDKNLKDWSWANMWAVLRKLSVWGPILIRTFSSFWCG